ncbi:putative uncharacterized protein DDB_G0283051 [Planococcus citri]|uniref:putative uncharacterized protein DDB_G0283051 n=1 Tax=Planococcus citri TaxID=170843 RepID=UPI0031F973DB
MKIASMGAFGILLIVSLAIGSISAHDDDGNQNTLIHRLNPRFKRQQNGFTLGQQVQTLQNQNGQQNQNQNQNGQQSGQQPSDFWQTGNNGNNGNNGNSQSQNTNTNNNNQGSNTNSNQGSTTTDAETQRVNDCIQRNCRQGVQLASLCGTDNVSYKNRPYFNCVRDCGRRIDVQHYGDCFTTRGAPNALSTG